MYASVFVCVARMLARVLTVRSPRPRRTGRGKSGHLLHVENIRISRANLYERDALTHSVHTLCNRTALAVRESEIQVTPCDTFSWSLSFYLSLSLALSSSLFLSLSRWTPRRTWRMVRLFLVHSSRRRSVSFAEIAVDQRKYSREYCKFPIAMFRDR